jgi:hypothetical protein
VNDDENAWVVYDPGGTNAHLSPEVREAVRSRHEAIARQRGPVVARVVVDVYSNGEAVPQVQFLTGGVGDEESVDAVRAAREALDTWR